MILFECFSPSFPLPVFHAWFCNAIRGSCTHVSSQTFFSTSGMKNCLFLNNLDKMHDGTINTRLVCFLSCESATFSCSTFLRSLADYTISLHAHSEPSRLITNWLSIDAHFLRSAAGCHVLIARYWSSDSNVSPMTQGVKTGSCLNFPSYFLFFSLLFFTLTISILNKRLLQSFYEDVVSNRKIVFVWDVLCLVGSEGFGIHPVSVQVTRNLPCARTEVLGGKVYEIYNMLREECVFRRPQNTSWMFKCLVFLPVC